MEKLIDLLNEYDKPVDEDEREYSEYSGNFLREEREDMERMSPEKLCGKKFGFIKWLVDNDKIDRGKLEVEYTDKQTLKDVYIAGAKQDELIIMLLAIQDEQIKFLISILR